MTEQSSSPTARPIRWKLLFILMSCGALANVCIRFLDFGDAGMKNAVTLSGFLASALLLVIWILFLSRLPRKKKGIFTLLLGGLFAALWFSVRIRGYYGDIVPIPAWAWQLEPDQTLPDIVGSGPSSKGKADPTPRPEEEISSRADLVDSPEFLGPNRNGRIPSEALPKDWHTTPPKERWRIPMGAGWSSFAVVGQRAYTQEQRGDFEWVACYDLKTGKPIWGHKDQVRFSEKMGGDGPRSTPTVFNGKVYALGATGILNCLYTSDGKRYWSKDTLKDSGQKNLTWGKSNAPLIVDDKVVVSLGKSKKDTLAAFNLESGELAWAAGQDESSYSSPVVAALAGQRQIVSIYANSAAGHEPASGRTLWTFGWPGGSAKCANPLIVGDNQVLLGAGYGLGSTLIKIERDGENWSATKIWLSRRMKTKFTTAIIREGYAFGIDDNVLGCVDLAKGERQWREGHFGHGQVLGVGDVLLILAESGEIVLVAADPKAYRELLRFPALNGKTWNVPALAGRFLLVRNDQEAVAFEWPR